MMVTVVDGDITPSDTTNDLQDLFTMTPAFYSEDGCPRCQD